MALDYDRHLQTLAEGHTLEDDRWPLLLDNMLPRMEHTVYNDFPIPSLPPPESPPLTKQGSPLSPGVAIKPKDETSIKAESSTSVEPPEKRIKIDMELEEKIKLENVEDTYSLQDVSATMRSPKREPESPSPSPSMPLPPNTLPPQLLVLLQTIQSNLRTNFPRHPPHTAQRLAELILDPKAYYRTLPSYLRALDRIVSVASSVNDFPLPMIAPPLNNTEMNNLFNGATSPDSDTELTDVIGGAELTPIPWLRDTGSPLALHNGHMSDLRTESTSLIDGPNGAGSVETVTVSVNGVCSKMPVAQAQEEGLHHGVTQGELIRQEQEAGITPVPTGSASGRITRSTTAAAERVGEATDQGETNEDSNIEGEETVHARGPPVIGMEDIGAQAEGSGLEKGIEIEGPLGIRKDGETAIDEMMGGTDTERSEGDAPATVSVHVDGAGEGEKGADSGGAEKGALAASGTTV